MANSAHNYSTHLEAVLENTTAFKLYSRNNLVNNFNDELHNILMYLSSDGYLGDTNFNYWYEMYKLPNETKLEEALKDELLRETLDELIVWIKMLKRK